MLSLRRSKKYIVIWIVISLLGVGFLSTFKTNSTAAVAASEQVMLELRVSTGADDAEQRLNNGHVLLDSNDLEMVNDMEEAKGDQIVGIRFRGVNIPKGATITKAYLEFKVSEAASIGTSLSIRGEAADNAAAFGNGAKNISKRTKTSASVSWDNPPAWETVGGKVESPDLAVLLREIVNRSGWVSGHSLVFIVEGTGKRVASAYEAGSDKAPLLHVEYTTPAQAATPTKTAIKPTTAATATPTAVLSTSTATAVPTQIMPDATMPGLTSEPTSSNPDDGQTITPTPTIIAQPTTAPTMQPTSGSTAQPTTAPTAQPTTTPTAQPTITPSAQPTIAPTAQPTATRVPASSSGDYMIMTRAQMLSLSTTSSAWNAVKAAADISGATPDLCNQDNRTHPKVALAAAMVYARGGNQAYADKARNLILAAYPTQRDGCSNAVLSLGRQLGAYVVAADLIRLNDEGFNTWLSAVRTKNIGGHSRWFVLRDTAYDSANNWGTFALASLIAADRFLGDTANLEKDWQVFTAYGVPRGWPFTKTSSYNEQWSCVSSDSTGKLPIAINTPCTKSGYNLDGAPVEDTSRTTFPSVGNYPAEAAQGYVFQAMVLAQAGYPAWSVNDSQLKRVAMFRERFGNLNYSSADYYVTWMTNMMYGLNQPTQPAGYGRVFGFTDWLFAP